MSLQSTLILLGILVALAPFSGLPGSWLEFILPLLGLATGIIGYTLRAHRKPSAPPAVHVDTATV